MRRCTFARFLATRGAAAIEFAIVLPVLLFFMFGLIDFGRAIWIQTTLNYAAQATARCRAVDTDPVLGNCRDNTTAAAYGASQAYGLSGVTVTVSLVTSCNNQNVAATQAIVTAHFAYFTPILSRFSGTLSATACYPS